MTTPVSVVLRCGALGQRRPSLLHTDPSFSLLLAHLPHDVVPFTEEGKPIIKNLLLLVAQILPIRPAIFGFERRQGQSS